MLSKKLEDNYLHELQGQRPAQRLLIRLLLQMKFDNDLYQRGMLNQKVGQSRSRPV